MKISCIIPLYNAEKYIGEALESLLRQSFSVNEIIVVDDRSKDDSVSIVEEYIKKYPNIKIIKQSANLGASAARNKGIEAANGEWLLFLDADDYCNQNLLLQYANYIEEVNNADMLYSQFIQIDESSNLISKPIIGEELKGNEGFCKMILRNPIISPSGILIKKDIIVQLIGFNESIKYVEDVDLWLRLLLASKNIAYLDIPGSYIRRHATNTTNSIDITNIGEKIILKNFGLELIKEKIYKTPKTVNEKHLDYINILIRFEKFDLAKDLLNQIQVDKKDSSYLSFLFLKARVYLYFEDYYNAKLLFEEILLNDSDHGAALNNLGVIAASNDEFKLAINYFNRALNLFPNYLDAKHNASILEKENAEYKFTYRELRKSLLHYS